MKIGLDLDGVICNFYRAYEDLIVSVTGEDKFPAKYPDVEPPVWNWPQHYGYSNKQISRVWDHIRESAMFWADLEELPGFMELAESDPYECDFTFVTARASGRKVLRQTNLWFRRRGWSPTVLLSSEKGAIASALGFDAYIDDKPENCLDVIVNSPKTRCYILDRAYNRTIVVPGLVRVSSVAEMFEKETVSV